MKQIKKVDWTYEIWRHLILFIFIGLTVKTIYSGFHGKPILGFVTNMGILSLTTILVGLYLNKTREFTFNYLVFAGFGLAWTIFAIRFTFPVVSDVNWFQQQITKRYTLPLTVGRFGDFLIHVLPLLTYYAILYLFGKTLKERVNRHPLWIKLIMAYSPYGLICLWSLFHNPYETYSVPDNLATWSILYIGIPILLLLTSSRPIFLMHTAKQVRITYLIQVVGLFLGILMGIHIFGYNNLTNSIISFTSTVLLIYLLVRVFFKNHNKYLSYFFLPVFGLIIGQVLCREMYFIYTGESHQHFIELVQPNLSNAHYWYSLYLVFTYVFIFSTTSTLLASDFPKEQSFHSAVRDNIIASRKACTTKLGKNLHEMWHTYGGVGLMSIFLLININNRYDLGFSTKIESDVIFLIAFIIIGYSFPGIFYRRSIKKLADLP